MDKDFRIGLIAGVVLVVAALIWVATRPSLRPQARLQGPAVPSSRRVSPPVQSPPAPPGQVEPSPRALPQGVIPAEPDVTPERPLADLRPATEPGPAGPTRPNYPDLTVYEQTEPIQTTKFHIVQKDESLSSISQRYYGTPNRWQQILRANRDAIKDPNRIIPGTKLIIPD